MRADLVLGPAEASAKLGVVELPEHFDLTRSPSTARSGKADAPPFAFGDDFLDGAPKAAGQHGIGHSAKKFYFRGPPGSARFSSRHVSHLFLEFEEQFDNGIPGIKTKLDNAN